MEETTLDLTIKASQCLGFCAVKKDFVRLTDLKNEDTSKGLKRRIIAITEGIHNRIQFRAAEIEAMAKRAIEAKAKDNTATFKIPIVLDHSDDFLDKVGSTFNLEYGKDPANGKPAIIQDVEFWNSTPMLKEVAERVLLDPENTFFSVRVRGQMKRDDIGDYLADMTHIHTAVVNEPADTNARLISNKVDRYLNSSQPKENPIEEIMLFTDEQKIELRGIFKEMMAQEKPAETKTVDQSQDIDTKVNLMAELIAMDPKIDRDLLKSMTVAQLGKYKAELARISAEKSAKTTEKSHSGTDGTKTAAQLAEEYFGKIGVI